MFSFAEENRGSLEEFFSQTVRSRVGSILHPEGCKLKEWTANQDLHQSLKTLCPAIHQAEVLTGIHSEALLLSDCVVKTNVFGEPYRDGQMSWLSWCMQHQNNPLVPRLSLLLVDEETERFLTVMERLVPHSGFVQHYHREDIDRALKAAFQRRGTGPAFRKELRDIQARSQESINELQENVDLLDSEEDDELLAVIETQVSEHRQAIIYINELLAFQSRLDRELRKFYSEIHDKFRSAQMIGQVIDVHGMNWMFRQNGSPVILDPIN